jgi:hypothetical protein
VNGDVQRINSDRFSNWFGFTSWLAIWIILSISSLLLGLLLLFLAPRAAEAVFATAGKDKALAAVWGVVLIIGLPLVGLILLATILGFPLGVGLLLLLLPLLAVAHATTMWIIGRAIIKPPRNRVLAFIVGWAILQVAALIPIVNGLVGAAATIFGLGILGITLWQSRRGNGGSRDVQPATASN